MGKLFVFGCLVGIVAIVLFVLFMMGKIGGPAKVMTTLPGSDAVVPPVVTTTAVPAAADSYMSLYIMLAIFGTIGAAYLATNYFFPDVIPKYTAKFKASKYYARLAKLGNAIKESTARLDSLRDLYKKKPTEEVKAEIKAEEKKLNKYENQTTLAFDELNKVNIKHGLKQKEVHNTYVSW